MDECFIRKNEIILHLENILGKFIDIYDTKSCNFFPQLKHYHKCV